MMEIIKYFKNQYEENLTKNFKVKEFACKDNSDYLLIDIEIANKEQKIRDYFDTPIINVSAFRTESYNEKCGGAKTSRHLIGGAIDFTFKDKELFYASIKDIIVYADKIGIKGIGVYTFGRDIPFIHIDNRTTPQYWINYKDHNEYMTIAQLKENF